MGSKNFPICTLGEGGGALSLRHCQLKPYRYENHDFHHAPSAFRQRHYF